MNQTTAPLNKHRVTRAVNHLLAKGQITPEDMQKFTSVEINYIGEMLTECLSKLKGEERDKFLNKILPTMNEAGRNDVWEYNHHMINQAISTYIKRYGTMPGKADLAKETGLSRQTITKHLNGYGRHPMFVAEAEQFKFMSNKVLASVYRLADSGDMRAAKLYFEMVGTLNRQPSTHMVAEQNNYIQINNTVLSQQSLKQLSAEQLNQIESIISANVLTANSEAVLLE